MITLQDIRNYCLRNKIKFELYLFNFKGSNKYESLVQGKTGSSSSNSSPNIDNEDRDLIPDSYNRET